MKTAPKHKLGHFYEDYDLYQVLTGRCDPTIFLRESRQVARIAASYFSATAMTEIDCFRALEFFSGKESNHSAHIEDYLCKVGIIKPKNSVWLTTELRQHKDQDHRTIIADVSVEETLKNVFKSTAMRQVDMVYISSDDLPCVQTREDGEQLVNVLDNAWDALNKYGCLVVPLLTTPEAARASFPHKRSTSCYSVPPDSGLALRNNLRPKDYPELQFESSCKYTDGQFVGRIHGTVKLTSKGTTLESWTVKEDNKLRFYEAEQLIRAAQQAGFGYVMTSRVLYEVDGFEPPTEVITPKPVRIRDYKPDGTETMFLFSIVK